MNELKERLKQLFRHARNGMTKAEISVEVFNRHASSADIDEALRLLHGLRMADYQVEASGGAPIQRWFFTEGNQRKKRMKTLRTPISSLNSHDSNGESGKGCHAANSLPGPVQMDIASRCSTSTSTAAKKSWAKKSQSPQTSDRAMEIARHEKARADVKQFKRDLDGLTEKPQLCELFRKGYNAKQACDALNIRPEDYRRWFENDVEFRVQLYLAVCSR